MTPIRMQGAIRNMEDFLRPEPTGDEPLPPARGSVLPCPFCGGEAVCEQHKQGGWQAYCVECKIGTYGEWSQRDALAIWNRRTAPNAPGERPATDAA